MVIEHQRLLISKSLNRLFTISIKYLQLVVNHRIVSSEKEQLHVGKDWEDWDLDQIPDTQHRGDSFKAHLGDRKWVRSSRHGSSSKNLEVMGVTVIGDSTTEAGGPASVPLNQWFSNWRTGQLGLKKHAR